jgi:hypothetical protein
MGGYHIHHSGLGGSKVRPSLRYVFVRNSTRDSRQIVVYCLSHLKVSIHTIEGTENSLGASKQDIGYSISKKSMVEALYNAVLNLSEMRFQPPTIKQQNTVIHRAEESSLFPVYAVPLLQI